jgi:hypothetical protein
MALVEGSNHPLFSQAIARLRRGIAGDLSEHREAHQCSSMICAPQCEESLIQAGKLVGPALTSNLYLCRLGSIHICTEQTHADGHTCPISGRMFNADRVSSYAKDDPRTWNSKPEISGGTRAVPLSKRKRATNTHKELTDDEVTQKATAMVKLLLYSSVRAALNRDAILRHEQEAKDAVCTYTKQQMQNKQLPFWTDMYRIVSYYSAQPLPYVEFCFDQTRCDYYVHVIRHMWKRIQLYYALSSVSSSSSSGGGTGAGGPPRLHFEHACLGILYAMRQGVIKQNHELLPKDNFLLLNLPCGQDLQHFNIQRNSMSKGETILECALNNALYKAHVSVQELQLNMLDMPVVHEAANNIVQVEHTQVPVKIGSNGEKLFMPTSRRKKLKK